MAVLPIVIALEKIITQGSYPKPEEINVMRMQYVFFCGKEGVYKASKRLLFYGSNDKLQNNL